MWIKRRRQDFPCISLAPAFIYPFIYISLCIWYHFCVLSSKYLSSCTNKTDFTVGVWGSTERYIVLLLKYNLWTRNDHRCKFILCTFFFLNKNMYISIWGESSIKMSEPGEYCHTQRRTHTHTCSHTQKSHTEGLLEKQAPTNAWWNPALFRKAGAGLAGPGMAQSGSTGSLGCTVLPNLAFLRRGKRGNNTTHQMGFLKPS